nr:neuronal regeneration-related protein [Odocoileus virginianus texanus]
MYAKAKNESWNDSNAEEQIRIIVTGCQFLTVVVYLWWQNENVILCVCVCLCALQGRLPVPKEVNRKKAGEMGAASLTPLGSSELHSPGTSYLHSF